MTASILVPADGAPYNAGEHMLEAAAETGARARIRCAGAETTGRGLREHALALQGAFADAGLARGERVLLVLRDTPLFHAAFLGALRGGFVPVPISTLLPAKDVAFIARDCDARAVVADVELPGELLGALPHIAAAGERVRAPAAAPTRAGDVAFFLYTSGTTGEPKGVVHRHVDLAVTAARYAQPVLGLAAGDRVLSAAKLFFAYGLGNSLTFPLLCGADVVLCPERPTPEAMFALLREAEPTIFFGVPTLYAAMLAHPELPTTLGRVRLCVSAGEALPAPLWQRWRERFGVEILDGLGSTEMLHIFVSNRQGGVRPGSSGTPVDGYTVRVVDDADRDVAPGEIGALVARGDSAARGYHARPETTARTMFAPDWLRTGDSYRRDADGTLWHVGRSDDLMKVSGQYVSPVEVESALAAHEAVLEAAVVADRDEHGLVKPRAFVVLAPAAQASDGLARELQEFVKARLSPHKYPRRVDFVDELPKTATGKIRRHVLREKSGMTLPDGAPATFETEPARWRHWRLAVRDRVARLTLAVDEKAALMDGVLLKRNSYDLGVDVELRDAVERLRFEHPEVACVLIESASPDVFCAGANIGMLARASHALKVNFCKLTNETRFAIEDASAAGQRYVAVLAGTASGGGYELALACERIVLVDDRRAAVSLPELPLLAVLPGTGGLTRLVDKRRVRPDLADVFCTLEEGVRAPRAFEWGLVDAIAKPSELSVLVQREIDAALSAAPPERAALSGVRLPPLAPEVSDTELRYRFLTVALAVDRRCATLTLKTPATLSDWLRLARELDDALLRLRFHHPELGLWLIRTEGDSVDDAPLLADDWLARETRALFGRVLKRLECSARSIFAIVGPGSCFHGAFLELALAADRIYMWRSGSNAPTLRAGGANRGTFPRANGLSRLEQRFLGDAAAVERVLALRGPIGADEALALGLVTDAPDDVDWEDAMRVVVEERVSFSPDALTGLEASLRFGGPETLETKVFARLSAWQNWIFQRPNAAGPDGALAAYGRPERAKFDWKRT